MKTPDVFIVLSSTTVGGVEKRFAGLWLDLRRRGDERTRLVLPRSLFTLMSGTSELGELARHREAVVVTSDSKPGLMAALLGLRLQHPRAVFHYTLLPPVLAPGFRPDRTVLTVPYSTLRQLNWRGLAPLVASVALSRRTDVLDDGVCAELKRRVPFRAGSLSVTPGSFVDLDFYRPGPVKEPRLAFTGLFSEEKQIDRLVGCVPELDRALARAGVKAQYRFMGRETREPGVAAACAAMPGVDVKAWFEPNPVSVLQSARGFFSLQRANNYPSKALLEAMACGCLPIVTDVGTSRRIASPDFAYFVPRDFTVDDLRGPAQQILTMPEPEFQARVRTMREFLAARFSVDTMRRYYEALWAEAAA